MSIEQDIVKTIMKSTFNKKLPEFIDRAKFLEKRLKEGEQLFFQLTEYKAFITDYSYYIGLDLHKRGIEPRTVIFIGGDGKLRYEKDLFKDYKPIQNI